MALGTVFTPSLFIIIISLVISLGILPSLSLQMGNTREEYSQGDEGSSEYGQYQGNFHPLIRRLQNLPLLPFPFAASARQVPSGPDPLHHNRYSPSRSSP